MGRPSRDPEGVGEMSQRPESSLRFGLPCRWLFAAPLAAVLMLSVPAG